MRDLSSLYPTFFCVSPFLTNIFGAVSKIESTVKLSFCLFCDILIIMSCPPFFALESQKHTYSKYGHAQKPDTYLGVCLANNGDAPWYDNSAVLCFCLCNSLHLPTVLTMFITLTSQSVEVPVDAHSSLTIRKTFLREYRQYYYYVLHRCPRKEECLALQKLYHFSHSGSKGDMIICTPYIAQ